MRGEGMQGMVSRPAGECGHPPLQVYTGCDVSLPEGETRYGEEGLENWKTYENIAQKAVFCEENIEFCGEFGE